MDKWRGALHSFRRLRFNGRRIISAIVPLASSALYFFFGFDAGLSAIRA